MSDKIQPVLNKVGVRVAVKPHLTIRKPLPSLKDPLESSEKSCLVYRVPCRDCSFEYIGQTKRDLKSRLDEHKRAVAHIYQPFVSILSLRTTLSPGQKPKFWNWKPITVPEMTSLRKMA